MAKINFDDLKNVKDDDIAIALNGGYGAEIRAKVRALVRAVISGK